MKPTLLYVDDEEDNLNVFKLTFRHDFNVITADSAKKALFFLRESVVDLIISDYKMPEQNGIEFLTDASKEFPEISRIMLTAYQESELIIKSVNKAHVFGYIAKPWVKEEFLQLIKSALESTELRRQNQELVTHLSQSNAQLQKANQEIQKLKSLVEAENKYLRQEIASDKISEFVIGPSANMNEVQQKINQVARLNTTVLIQGETGTGKELVARSIHKLSGRVDKPFVKLNCASLPAALVESELFGFEKGAFTGANQNKPGLFEIADGGTIFLDEVGELPLELQPKLLRVLQEGEFYKIGSSKPVTINVRVVAATNRVLSKEVAKGLFRSDLYYRLNIFPIDVPPLRERREDIPFLAKYLISKCERKLGIKNSGLSKRDMEYLVENDWPGNIRELEAVLERSLIVSQGGSLQILQAPITERVVTNEHEQVNFPIIPYHDMEKRYIQQVLMKTKGRISGKNGAASLLKINHNTLRSKIQKFGIDAKEQAPPKNKRS